VVTRAVLRAGFKNRSVCINNYLSVFIWHHMSKLQGLPIL
jgi:hypothetical protein